MMQPIRGAQVVCEDSPDMYNGGYYNPMVYNNNPQGVWYSQAVPAANVVPAPQPSLNLSGVSSTSSLVNGSNSSNPSQ